MPLLAPAPLFAIGFAYLGLLFLIAHATDRGLLPDALTGHPLVYSLSLGVYATSWTYYGSVGLADRSGYVFLTIYLGVTGAFLLGPRLLAPLLALCREYQLTSIADLLAFRYGGRATGAIVTLFLLLGTLPYLSLQIQAVSRSLQVLTGETRLHAVAFGFCVVILLFTLLFGARHLSMRERHRGLVSAIAFESAIKLLALLIAAGFILFEVFDSPGAFVDWTKAQPGMLDALYEPTDSPLWTTLLLLAFSAAFLLPRQYHMMFVENERPEHLTTAYWLFPLYLLLLNLPIVPILFAGRLLGLSTGPDFYVLGISLTLQRDWLSVLIFLGGLSAASAMIIVTTLALSSMCVNHLLLPASLSGAAADTDGYRRILGARRRVIALLIAGAYAFTLAIDGNRELASLGLISFVAAAQLLPGTLGLLFWARGTANGFVCGLSFGALAWAILLILPLFAPASDPAGWFPVQTDPWTRATFVSLSVNVFGFVLGSLLLPVRPREQALGELTTLRAADAGAGRSGMAELARSGIHYRYAMQRTLGERVAQEEFARALRETGVHERETRRAELRQLHDRLERNLTGLMGPTLARDILAHHRPAGQPLAVASEDADARWLEQRLEASRARMRGLTKQLDDLRRYLRDVLRELPIGVFSLSADGRILLWNRVMASITGVADDQARERALDALPAPWAERLGDFVNCASSEAERIDVDTLAGRLTLDLRRARIGADLDATGAGQVILVEDRTSLMALEMELAHSERLASIGRLAAGVAHEIGNPLTGIASLAQNMRADVLSMSGRGDGLGPEDAARARSLDDDEAGLLDEQAGDILEQVARIDGIVQSLLGFSRGGSAQATVAAGVVDLAGCIDEAVRLVRYSPDVQDLRFEQHVSDGFRVQGIPNQLVQVFVNLLDNACQASPANGTVHLEARRRDGTIAVSVHDQGTGLSDEVREKMFDPFFTTKPVGAGTGLGLSLVYSIVTRHGGKVRSRPGGHGATLEVSLPDADVPRP